MKFFAHLAAVGSFAALAAAGGQDPFHRAAAVKQAFVEKQQAAAQVAAPLDERDDAAAAATASSSYLNAKSKKFVVNGKAIPDVPFDVGESYAGLLPISNSPTETRKLYFWFFPSQNPKAKDEIAVWLNGGPGCSSLSGLLTENGPFLYQAGTKAPTPNPYGWNKMTNYVWIEQPVGVGYSQGVPNITNEIELAEQFKGFWKNFVDTFGLQRRKVYITGESYAGFYVPYIANSFIKAKDTTNFNLKGIAINDPIIGDDNLQQELVVPPYVNYWNNLMYLNTSYVNQLKATSARCGFTKYYDTYFKFPAQQKPFPPVPDVRGIDCDLFSQTYEAALEVNPCFNIYHITDTCPFPYGHLGIVNTGDYSPPGAVVYFDRADVKKAINAPANAKWYQCTPKDVFVGGDRSPGPALDGTLQNVIEKTNNVIVGSGALDFLLSTNGTLFALQNTTWNGKQGLQKRPSTPFFVPYHPEPNGGAQAGAGNLGVYGVERGLTFYDLQLAGHEVPGYAAGGGLRSLELLLGRIKSLSDKGPFTIPINNSSYLLRR